MTAERRELIVLVHVPKTAGTTLAQLLRYHYRGGGFKGAGNAFTRPDETEERLRKIAEAPEIHATAGHVTFGLAAELLPRDARFVTILRDPVERTLSHYHFLRQSKQGGGLVPPWLPRHEEELRLERCFEPRSYIPEDVQTRMLCGLVSPYDELPADALDLAKRNLRERFAYVGTTERFDELLALLNLGLGWPTTAYEPARPNPSRRDDDSEELRRLAEEHNRLDRELHEYADGLLTEAAGPEVGEEAAVIREAVRRWNGGADGGRDDERVVQAVAEAANVRAEFERRKLARKAKRARR
jgi:hypothetical protein